MTKPKPKGPVTFVARGTDGGMTVLIPVAEARQVVAKGQHLMFASGHKLGVEVESVAADHHSYLAFFPVAGCREDARLQLERFLPCKHVKVLMRAWGTETDVTALVPWRTRVIIVNRLRRVAQGSLAKRAFTVNTTPRARVTTPSILQSASTSGRITRRNTTVKRMMATDA